MALSRRQLIWQSTRHQLPIWLALASAVAGAVVGWRLVQDDVIQWRAVGFGTEPEYRFVIFMMLLFAVLTYLLSNRLLNGPKLTHDEWTLFLRPTGVSPKSYRDATVVRLEPLSEALAGYGYRLTFYVLTDRGEHPASGTTALVGTVCRVRERSARHGSLTFRIAPDRVDAPTWGSIEIDDTRKEIYGELAQYLIYELGKLIPGLEYKRSFSALSLEATCTLAPQLPERPLFLGR